MIKWIFIAAFCFLVGNVVWSLYYDYGGGLPEKYDRLYFVPNSALILVLFIYAKKVTKSKSKRTNILFDYFVLLSAGCVIKELLYESKLVKQLNDYVWGGLLTIGLIAVLWATRKRKTSGKA